MLKLLAKNLRVNLGAAELLKINDHIWFIKALGNFTIILCEASKVRSFCCRNYRFVIFLFFFARVRNRVKPLSGAILQRADYLAFQIGSIKSKRVLKR